MAFGESILQFLNTIGSGFQQLFHFLARIPQLFRIISFGVSTLVTCFNMLPEWFFVLGVVTILAAVLWIIVEII